jgi:hypothetical protein
MHSLRSKAPRLYWYKATSNAAHVHLATRSSAIAAGSTAFAGSQILKQSLQQMSEESEGAVARGRTFGATKH